VCVEIEQKSNIQVEDGFLPFGEILFREVVHNFIKLIQPNHNVCKTVWLSEVLLVYGEMTWTLLADSLDELRKCL
jgi:hypothetical protein